MTTIKLQKETRDLITSAAREEGLTVDEFLSHVMAERMWQGRMAAARAMMVDPDPEYLHEVAAWDSLATTEAP